MTSLLQKARNTVRFHYYRKKNNWSFPPNMAHTSGARVADGTYEPDLTRCITDRISEGAIVIDVGANVGYYSRLFARAVKKKGKVIAFEAESENYSCLCKNIADYRQVTPVALAVSNKNTISELHLSSHSSCHSMLDTDNYQNKSSVMTLSVKLDSFWDLYLDRVIVDCIKVDVEGAEILVLEGMQEMLEQDAVQTMIIELCPQIIINSGFDPLQLYELISPGFTMKVVESEYGGVIKNGLINNEDQFNALKSYLLNSGDFVNCNLLCEQI